MKKQCFIQLAIAIAFSSAAWAGSNAGLSFSFRSKPQGNNPMGYVAYDGLLWGDNSNSNPLYGFYRIGAKFGGSPTAAAFFHFAPVAPLVFEVQRGMTARFLKSSTFDCDRYECKGTLNRTDYTVKLGAAYRNFIFVGSAMWREIQVPDNDRNVAMALELEYFGARPGFHRFFESSGIFGYKLSDDRTVGAIITAGEISDGNRRFNSAYGIYRWKWNDYTFTTGAGKYESEQPLRELGFIFQASIKFGEPLSLF